LADGSLSYDYSVLKPDLAESWTVADDGMSVVFCLPSATLRQVDANLRGGF
jgi:ABC-type transport system substrate-binding protein